MDPLSDLLADVRIRDALFVRGRLGASGHLAVQALAQPCFHLVTKGRAWLHVGGECEPQALQEGDLAFLPQGSAHRLAGQAGREGLLPEVSLNEAWRRPRPSGTLTVQSRRGECHEPWVAQTLSGRLTIEGVPAAWLCGALPRHLALRWGAEGMPPWLAMGLAYLAQELDRDGLARQAVIDRLGDVLFAQCLRAYLEAQPQGGMPALQGWLMGLRDEMLSRVLGAMHRAPERPWSLAALAREGCVSRTVLAERFSRWMGLPPLAYLTRLRMQVAARRLRSHDIPVGEVAHSVGYRSPAAFAQAFQRAHGCSPTHWRAQRS